MDMIFDSYEAIATTKNRLCARKWRSVHITRLSGKRRIRCAWRPAVVLSVAGS
jgi:hypothetical protein